MKKDRKRQTKLLIEEARAKQRVLKMELLKITESCLTVSKNTTQNTLFNLYKKLK